MKNLKNIVLIIEFFIAFGGYVFLWVAGLFYSPFVVLMLFGGSFKSFMMLGSIVFGSFGLIGIFQLLIKIIEPQDNVAPKGRLLSYVVMGVIALFMCSFVFDEPLSPILPLIVIIHFCYLNRWYLWP